jgi:L-aspartate oxidase
LGVFCGCVAAEVVARMPDNYAVPPVQARFEPETDGGPLDVADLTSSLRSLMVRRMGIVRDRPGLEEAERTVSFWCRYVLSRELKARAGWELQNLLTVARLMIWSALERTESRGVHFRADFPVRDDVRWQFHLDCPPRLPDAPTVRGGGAAERVP